MNGHDGDALVLNSSVAAAFGINIESDSENQFVVQLKRVRRETFSLCFCFSQRLCGSAGIKYYEMVLSSFGFVNNLNPPFNLSSDTRLLL